MNAYLIIGATSDLGRSLISKLLEKDNSCFVYAHGFQDEEKLLEIKKRYGNRIKYFDCDLSSKEDLYNMLKELSNVNITHFVSFAALPMVYSTFNKFDSERFLKDIQIQLNSTIEISKVILKEMKKNKFGRIVLMQSSAALSTPPKNLTMYTMVKGALSELVKSLAVEYAPYGITVNCVAPSMIETNFIKDLNHIIVETSAANNPMGRNATVDDVVPAIEFLLSEEARYITGVTLPITGGSVMI